MLIREVRVNNFMSHSDSVFTLPEKGVVVITGPNGAGKSTLMEAISIGCWGKSLRGSSPWRKQEAGYAEVEYSTSGRTGTITRKKNAKDKVSLSFTPCDTTYSTISKAQYALSNLIGEFDIWRRTSAFSSQDASHFTMATDSDRKRLLENLLGLDQFDIALGSAKEDGKMIAGKIRDLDTSIIRKSAALERCQDELKEDKEKLAHEKTKARYVCKPPEEIAALNSRLEEALTEHLSVDRVLTENSRDIYMLQSRESSLENSLLLFNNDQCPTCAQPLHGKDLQDKKISMEEDLKKATRDLENIKAQNKAFSQLAENLRKEIRETKELLSKEEFYREAQEESSLVQHLENRIIRLEKEESELSTEVTHLQTRLNYLHKEKSINENVQTVLGTKGVRAHILTSALKALEVNANKWLEKICGTKFRVKISPYSQKKSGGTKEAIALHIDGIAGGEGYKGASGGQRRRLDVAILLGLAELAQASEGLSGGTLFFDEVFDSLDSEGVGAISDVLESMGEHQPIVVISHSEELVSQLNTVAHFHIQDGTVAVK